MSEYTAIEKNLREKLAEIDQLRKKADTAERMHTRWDGFKGELVTQVTVKRRWYDKQTHSEWVMDYQEIEVFREYLQQRVGQLRITAEALTKSLGGEQK